MSIRSELQVLVQQLFLYFLKYFFAKIVPAGLHVGELGRFLDQAQVLCHCEAVAPVPRDLRVDIQKRLMYKKG